MLDVKKVFFVFLWPLIPKINEIIVKAKKGITTNQGTPKLGIINARRIAIGNGKDNINVKIPFFIIKSIKYVI